MEPQSTSTFIHFLRSVVLLAALIVVPATAVCWNMIPKDFFEFEKTEQATSFSIDSEESDESVTNDMEELNDENPVEMTTTPFAPSMPPEAVPTSYSPIKLMSGAKDSTAEQSISNPLSAKPVVQTAVFAETAPSYASEKLAQKSFPILESQLKQLDAKYYRLEKWGSRGELFRFSCYVAPSAPYQYQKYFQAIDSDELRVMENVIEEIKQWKRKSE